MSYRITVLPEAQKNLSRIYAWIAERSPDGAIRWYETFLASLEPVKANPESFSLAPENEHIQQEIRQVIFKTRRGNPYRILFTINEIEIRLLHVRGPGQRLLDADEIKN